MKTIGILAAAATLLASVPAAAAAAPVANPASKLSLNSKARASSKTGRSNALAESSPFLSVIIGAAAIGGLLLASGALGADDDTADSN
jgi:hypothetical protein